LSCRCKASQQHLPSDFRYLVAMSEKKRKKRTEYLSYIEDTPKHHHKLEKLAQEASRKAIEEAKANNIAITYFDGESIICEQPDGSKEVVGKVEEPHTPYVSKNASS